MVRQSAEARDARQRSAVIAAENDADAVDAVCACRASNRVEYVECSWGVPGAGMIAARELTYVLNDAEPVAVVVEPRFLPLLEGVLPLALSVERVVVIARNGESAAAHCTDYETLITSGAAEEPAVRGNENEAAWLLQVLIEQELPRTRRGKSCAASYATN